MYVCMYVFMYCMYVCMYVGVYVCMFFLAMLESGVPLSSSLEEALYKCLI